MDKILKLKGKTAVFVDWANVHGWEEKLKWKIDLKRLYQYLKNYEEIKQMRFYFGTDQHPASTNQIKSARRIGFYVITKPVKYLPVKDKNIVIWKRKCDFDLEIGLDCFEMLNDYDGFIFFTGDGDMATLYERLVKRDKQVIVVATKWSLGKEVAQIKRGIFILNVRRIKSFIKKSPRYKSGV
jgi:uncharacterized LabA/DUF88 family protein